MKYSFFVTALLSFCTAGISYAEIQPTQNTQLQNQPLRRTVPAGTYGAPNEQTQQLQPTEMGTRRFQRAPSAVELNPIVAETSWWRPSRYTYELGYEAAATNTTGVLGTSVVTGGMWMGDSFGLEFFMGYTKSANANTETISTSTNTIATPNTQTNSTSYSGTNAAPTFALAINPRYRLIQTDWFHLNIGLMVGLFLPSSADYQTGTKTETIANTTTPNNKSVSETSWGTVKSENGFNVGVGPRISSQFYIKWFPHLAVGLSTGVFTFLSGNTTTTTDTKTRSYTVVNGVDQTPTSETTTHTVATTKPGFRATTFGLGGTTFALTGSFTIRYIW
jgi:hypothetical protein